MFSLNTPFVCVILRECGSSTRYRNVTYASVRIAVLNFVESSERGELNIAYEWICVLAVV
jgi:hypothetical protein